MFSLLSFASIVCNGNIIFATTRSIYCVSLGWKNGIYTSKGPGGVIQINMAAKYKIEHGLVLKIVRHKRAIDLKSMWRYNMKDGMNNTMGSLQSCGMMQILEWQVLVIPVSIAKHTVQTTTGIL
jgi:hypothetical protein